MAAAGAAVPHTFEDAVRAALSVRAVTGVPIKFAGTSEKIDGLEVFDAQRHAGRVLGMGDIVALARSVLAYLAADFAAHLNPDRASPPPRSLA